MAKLRQFLFGAWTVLLTLVLGIVFLPTLAMSRGATRWAFNVWLRSVFWGLRWIVGVTWELRGAQYLPQGGALIASKHQSMFDTLAPWLFLPDPAIVLKKELTRIPIYGWWAVRLKNIVVDRGAAAKAMRDMLAQAKARAAEGRQILIFPEGTRTRPGERIEYKPGAAGLYSIMNVPCVPIALNSGTIWPQSGLAPRPGHIVVELLEPIGPGMKRDAFMTLLEARIETASARLLETGP
jgi:1-acyl-sn-glycerol-3-phosphate acyltransferase